MVAIVGFTLYPVDALWAFLLSVGRLDLWSFVWLDTIPERGSVRRTVKIAY